MPAYRLSAPPYFSDNAGTVSTWNEMLPAGRPLLIAEAGVNHNGSLETALKMVDAAAEAGADVVKFQTFRTGELVTDAAPRAKYQEAGGEEGGQKAMLEPLELDRSSHERIQERCRRSGILFTSTPFDEGSADLLAELEVPFLKVGSGEVTNTPFLEYLARKGLPMLLSTGMSTLEEVRAAVDAVRGAGCPELALLHCVSCYPARPEDSNLRAMATLADAFGLPTGYSDHTLGNDVPLAAAALGARIIEKHFTLDRGSPGPDHAASAEPEGLKALAASLAVIQTSLGDGVKAPRPSEEDTRRAARRSIVLRRAVAGGTQLLREDLAFKRPAAGIPPFELPRVLGRTLLEDRPADTVLEWGMLGGG